MRGVPLGWIRLGRAVADLIRVNARYLVDPGSRFHLRAALRKNGYTPQQRVCSDAELAAAPAAALPYAGLVTTSLTLAGIKVSDVTPPHLNLLIGEVRQGGMFAGIHTALTAAMALSGRLALPLRIVMLDFTSADNDRASAERYIRDKFSIAQVAVVPRESLREPVFSSRDVWLASHWKTAHAVQVANEINLIHHDRVIYLIQDYEAGFSPWSTESVLASSTYHAGFTPIVNSIPLWTYLCEKEGLVIHRDHVFAPSFELEKLREVAKARSRSESVTVLFYGRPSKHRNLYRLGISALKAAAATLGENSPRVQFFSAGEAHEEIDLGAGHRLTCLGHLTWDDYFVFLARTDVVLSLQQSPHPSHPPFDAAISGAIAITNDFHGARGDLHPRVRAVSANTADLADALVEAIIQAKCSPPGAYIAVTTGLLGARLEDAVDAVALELGR